MAVALHNYFFRLRFDHSANATPIKNHAIKNTGTNSTVSANGMQTNAARKKATMVIKTASVVLILNLLLSNGRNRSLR